MIVKFRTGCGWEFVGNVVRIQTVIEKSEDKPDYVSQVLVYKNDGVEMIIYLDKDNYQLYLMNDEGKTIERIN